MAAAILQHRILTDSMDQDQVSVVTTRFGLKSAAYIHPAGSWGVMVVVVAVVLSLVVGKLGVP